MSPSNISAEDLSKYYGAIKLEEFVTMALTDQGFQQHLNNITDEIDGCIIDEPTLSMDKILPFISS